ncbi:MAG: hypothetical protein M1831_003213 [Alyxoria varia]|nr:MAG: hypothetical protein M1831_003213 [Alyxoria varia]
MGMYAMGIPAGILIDRKTPRWGVTFGAIALACGYFPIYRAYLGGPESGFPTAVLNFCAFLTGLGSCTSFSAAIKTSTFNWPEHRGTATAFPLSGFGLSAFFFATLANVAFGDDLSKFLLLLSLGTLCLNAVALPFITLIPTAPAYSSLPTEEEPRPRSHSESDKRKPVSTGRSSDSSAGSATSTQQHQSTNDSDVSPVRNVQEEYSHAVEITGIKILPKLEFWQLFGMLGLLAGVGLMTINNIGNDAKALWRHWDAKATPAFLQNREQLHVSILSLGSFAGRLSSGTHIPPSDLDPFADIPLGVGSDFLVKRLRASRFWCLTVSAVVFTIVQLIAYSLVNPNLLFMVSGLTGLGYGALFGVFPALVADTFGVQGLSLNWGFMIFAPVVSSYGFNYAYGKIYDNHSHVINSGETDCPDGLECYQDAYRATLLASFIGILLSLWCIKHERARKATISQGTREA